MKMRVTLIMTSFVFSNFFQGFHSAHADPKFYRYQELQYQALKKKQGVHRNALLGESQSSAPTGAPDADPSPELLDQVLNHFAPSVAPTSAPSVAPAGAPSTAPAGAPSTAPAGAPSIDGGVHQTFKQRYFVDSSFAKDTNAPVILYLCGESECEGPTHVPLINDMAEKYGAYRVALEHRYYGKSLPFTLLTLENLRYLSMDQAIEDLAYFQKFLQQKLHLSGKWIVVGGSYAGELSAFYRLKHPELVEASIASSGPVFAKADFFEYDQHIAKVVTPTCLNTIQTIVKDIETRLLTPTTEFEVKNIFGARMLKSNIDFMYVVADMAASAIQYGLKEQFCSQITSAPPGIPALRVYASVGNYILNQLHSGVLIDSFQGMEEMDTSTTVGASGMRQWMYQSCTEFGFYQIANINPAESARSQKITLQYHEEACKKLFGIATSVDTAKTNRNFFDNLSSPHTTQIFFTNGSVDPWSKLSIDEKSATASANPNLSFLTIEGGSHCSDLGADSSAPFLAARAKLDIFVGNSLHSAVVTPAQTTVQPTAQVPPGQVKKIRKKRKTSPKTLF